jgi:hypothetical protein
MADVVQATLQNSGTASVRLVQTDALFYLLDAIAEHSDIGFFSASSEPFSRIPGLLVDEDVVLATAVTAGATIAWGDQLQDWVIPFNLPMTGAAQYRQCFPWETDQSQLTSLSSRAC